jgi:hypothetical protein
MAVRPDCRRTEIYAPQREGLESLRPQWWLAASRLRKTFGSSVTSRTLVNGTEIGSGVLPVIGAAMLSSSKGNLILGFDHPRSTSSAAVSSKSPQKANRIRLSGRRLANATPAEIAAMPPSARGNPTTQSTLPASA